MKFNAKKFLTETTAESYYSKLKINEENSGPDGGYIGYASDAEAAYGHNYAGISDPKNLSGSFGTVFQNKLDFKPLKSMDNTQLSYVNAAIMSYLTGTFADPRQALYNLRVKINHLGLDFDFNRNSQIIEGPMTLQLSRFGQKFGTTPTNDLRVGFDRGTDYTGIALSFTVRKDPSNQYYFENVRLGQTQGQQMQSENFYSAIANDEYLYENVMKPIMLNIMEKADDDTLTEDQLDQYLSFIVERAAMKFEMDLTEESLSELIDGLHNLIFEEEKQEKQIPTRGENLSTSRTNQSRKRRALAIERMRAEVQKRKGK